MNHVVDTVNAPITKPSDNASTATTAAVLSSLPDVLHSYCG